MSYQGSNIDHAIKRATERLAEFFATPRVSRDGCRNPGGLREISDNLLMQLSGWQNTPWCKPSSSTDGEYFLQCLELSQSCSDSQRAQLLDLVQQLFKARHELQQDTDQGRQKHAHFDRHLTSDWEDTWVPILLALKGESLLASSA